MQYLSAVCNHPSNENIKLIGSKNEIYAWDTRESATKASNGQTKPAKTFKSFMGQIQDLVFLDDERFASSGDIVSKDSAEYSIMVWDYASTAVLSNQIFHEKYVCTCLRKHPFHSIFFAQTHGNYICEFSSTSPFKMNKYKRFESTGHATQGCSIGFDLNPSGNLLASGSLDGFVYVYNASTSKLEFKIKAFGNELTRSPCMDVKFNTSESKQGKLIAASSSNGVIKVYQL